MKGIGASNGYCIGKAWVISEETVVEPSFTDNIENARISLEEAFKQLKSDLEKESGVFADIFKAHLLMLTDPDFKSNMLKKIENQHFATEYAVQCVMNEYVLMFEGLDNAYFAERAIDVKDICRRLIKKIRREDDSFIGKGPHIIVAKDLTPSDTAKLDTCTVKGFITTQGGDTSHSAIIARTLGIPAIMGLKDADILIKNGDFLVLDGFTGEVFVNPSSKLIRAYQEKINKYEEEQNALLAYKDLKSQTKCGKVLEFSANIAMPEDVANVLKYGADGVGLFRSEFVYMNRKNAPTEEEQFNAYKAVLEGMAGKPVIIRTLDIGGDKNIPYLNIPNEMNPFLGYRAIRICLKEVSFFKTQLRALLRASVYGNLKIMYPMISSLEELRSVKSILKEVKQELFEKGVKYASEIEEGIMIEVPSAALISDLLAEEVDFFSIGTNDLIQYTLAVDRMNENIKDLYTPYHPSLIRLIHMTIQNGLRAGIWVGMCGSVAGNPKLIPILIAMGLTEFSMGPNQILTAKKIARSFSLDELRTHLHAVLSLKTSSEVFSYLEKNF